MKQTLTGFCIIIYISVLSPYRVTAQASLGDSYTSTGNLNLNLALTPPGPQAFQFQKYGNVPVNYATGVPSIAIPLYTIGLKNFSWPISLSYHAGGNRVDEIASNVGLGWVLMAGGYMTSNNGSSTIAEEPLRLLNLDGLPGPHPANPNYNECYYYNENDIYIADELAKHPNVPAIYNITSPVLSNKFFISGTSGYTLPSASGVKINMDAATNVFNITDEGGTIYTFKYGGKSYRSALCNGEINMSKNETYVLDKITTYSGETLNFYYDALLNYGYSMPKSYSRHVRENNYYPVNGNVCNDILPVEMDSCDNNFSAEGEVVLSRIEASNGIKVQFSNISRSDMPYGRRTNAVEIYKNSYDPASLIKKIELGQDYFGSGSDPNDLRLKLETVTVKDNNNAVAETYSFTYNNTQLPNRLSNNSDAAGFYRQDVVDPTHFEIRDYNLATTKACVLEKMTYPTGGNTQFTYGLNPWGGLRIDEIADYDVDNKQYHFRKFEYPAPATPVSLPSNMDAELVWMTAPTPGGGPGGDETGAIYPVTCSKTRYQSSPVTPAYAVLDPDINYYNKVTEFYGNTTPSGKTEYYYGADAVINRNDMPKLGPILAAKKVFAQNGTGFTLLQEEHTKYTVPAQPANEPFYENGNHPLVHKMWYKNIKKNRDQMNTTHTAQGGSQTIPVCFPKLFFQSDMVIASVPLQKTEESNTVYSNGQTLETKLLYKYDDINNLAPTEVKTIDSRGTELITKLYYPTNTSYAGAALTTAEVQALTKLKNDNIKSSPYFTETYAGTQCLGKKKMSFTEAYNKAAGNKLTEWAACDAPPKVSECLQFDARLNCTESKTDDGTYTAAIFSPLSELYCQVINAPLSDIAATSFENAGETGGFTFSGFIFSAPHATAPTGKAVGNTGLGISKTGLNTAKTYIVSYWSNSGPCMVNSSTATAGRSVNGWTFYQHKIPNPTAGTITINSTGQIDELRLYPQNALITTYTYEPFTGLSTQCDANNKISYYEYDSFKRLKLIKDQDGNVVKTFEYKYNATPQQ